MCGGHRLTPRGLPYTFAVAVPVRDPGSGHRPCPFPGGPRRASEAAGVAFATLHGRTRSGCFAQASRGATRAGLPLPQSPTTLMPNSFYYYDHDACTFVEVEPDRKGLWLKAGAVLSLAFVISAVGLGVMSQFVRSPVEVAQREEIRALQGELEETTTRLVAFSDQLEGLAETDREIYRTVLNAEPITPDEFQMGVGGAAEREDLVHYSTPTAQLLKTTHETIGRLERQVALQNRSYDELKELASSRDEVLRQQPAILPLKNARLTSGFGMRYHPILHTTRMHAGVDFPTPTGTELYAAGDGVVSFIGDKGGYGIVMEIEHPLAGKLTRYAHLSRAAPGVRVGSAVRRGQTVAYSGNTGLSTAPHLHYEVRLLNEERTPINPVTTFVPGVSPSEYRELLQAARTQTVSFD